MLGQRDHGQIRLAHLDLLGQRDHGQNRRRCFGVDISSRIVATCGKAISW